MNTRGHMLRPVGSALAVTVFLAAAGCACIKGPTPLVERQAPTFTADAVMADDSVAPLSLSDLAGHYVLLVFYPADFTYVCPTELIALDTRLDEFEQLDCRVVGVSVDPPETHLAWRAAGRNAGGVGPLKYPLVSDTGGRIARAYHVLGPDGRSLRAWFILGRDGVVRHMLVNEPALGRSVDEALRLTAAVKTIDEVGRLCPVDWEPGDETVGPAPEPGSEGGGT
jgi:peroxiredoxin (alkyl hydroperoxide reductase subunit C)